MNPHPKCAHTWVSNSGRGGKPQYRPHRETRFPVMHVQCSRCYGRTWLTPQEWNRLPERRRP